MLRIYQSRENIDKEQFIYEQVKGEPEALIIVPDQYTLVAEEQAMKHLHTACLLHVEILSMNRLGLKMLEEQGTENVQMLDQYERFMILGRIIRGRKDQLDVFRLPSNKNGFVDMVSDFISDFKQQECTLEELRQMAEDPEADPLFRKKIMELAGILEEYQSLVEGKYKDVADYADMYTDAMRKSQKLRNQSVWIYGYDSMPPKFVESVMAIASVAKDVSVMVNASDFGLDQVVVHALTRAAEGAGLAFDSEWLTAPVAERSETIRRIEAGLFDERRTETNEDFEPKGLTVVECATMYNEAESAAVYIYELMRRGYRMKDIAIICNDRDAMQPIVERTFREYGLPLFRDERRMVRDSQAVGFVMNLLDICSNGYRTGQVLAVLKSELTGTPREDIWNLENYARIYGIKGNMWKKPLSYGSFEYSEEEFAKLEETRAGLVARIDRLTELAENSKTVLEFIQAFTHYLDDTWNLQGQIQEIQAKQTADGMLDEAQWTAQCYNEIIRVLDCVRDILGDDEFSIQEFSELYSVGILHAEVGMIPPTNDGLSIGTMIRSRTAPPKVVVVLSANEGTLPAEPSTEGLFSVDEKNIFQSRQFPLGHLDDLQQLEQNAAMYRMVSRASDELYVSYSLADGEGSDKKPSVLVESLRNLFPRLRVQHDVLSKGFGVSLIQSPRESIRHMMNHYKERPVDQMAEMVGAAENAAKNAAENTAAGATASNHLTASAAAGEAAGTDGSTTDGKKAGGANGSSDSSKPSNNSAMGFAPANEDDYLAEGILRWYEKNDPVRLRELTQAGLNENEVTALSRNTAGRLYGKDGEFSFSASRLEGFNHCPFKHYVNYGLRADEQREYTGDSRGIGDVYHECMMRISRRLVKDGILETGDGSTNNGIISDSRALLSDSQLAQMIDEELTAISSSYQGGLFLMNGREKYHMHRIRRICLGAVRSLADQLATGKIEIAFFEERFGRGCRFQPIEYTLHGQKVYIEGKIDRVDVMEGGNIRIVDYKTGSDKLDLDKMRDGYKMQLMVYLDGASGRDKEPVGMFYFNIAEQEIGAKDISAEKLPAKLAAELAKSYKLNGAVMDEPAVLAGMPVEQLGSSTMLSREDFHELRDVVHKKIESISDDIVEGKIDIFPAKENSSSGPSACTYCNYKAICRFDLSYRNNNYRVLKKTAKSK